MGVLPVWGVFLFGYFFGWLVWVWGVFGWFFLLVCFVVVVCLRKFSFQLRKKIEGSKHICIKGSHLLVSITTITKGLLTLISREIGKEKGKKKIPTLYFTAFL